jgi:hypothetical protein
MLSSFIPACCIILSSLVGPGGAAPMGSLLVIPPIEEKQAEEVIEMPQATVEEKTREAPIILNIVIQDQDGKGNKATAFFAPQADNKADTLGNLLRENDVEPASSAESMLAQTAREAAPRVVNTTLPSDTLLVPDEEDSSDL